jgi:hypothetical protein
MTTFSKSISVVVFLCIGVLLCSTVAPAQSTGTITGTVIDESGAIIPGATVTVTNKATSVSRNLVSNEQGLYSAPALEPGKYDVRVQAKGFRDLVSEVEVFAGTNTAANAPMKIGDSQQVVNVEASAAQIN